MEPIKWHQFLWTVRHECRKHKNISNWRFLLKSDVSLQERALEVFILRVGAILGAGTGIFRDNWGCNMAADLTHWGLVTPYGERDLGQHWLTAPSHYLNQCWLNMGGGGFKNMYGLLNLRALKISVQYQNHIYVWVWYFMWNFKGSLWNSTQNILPIHI